MMPFPAMFTVLLAALLVPATSVSGGSHKGGIDKTPDLHHLKKGDKSTTLASCLQAISGATLYLPSTSGYSTRSLSYNLRTQSKPAALLYVTTPTQVQQGIFCGLKYKTRVVPRGAGHSFEGYSVQNGVIVIDFSKMNAIQVTGSHGLEVNSAQIGAGATLGQVYKTLWNSGSYAFPGGTSGEVGLAGLITGGGFGFLTRSLGLASDNLIGVRGFLANGTAIDVHSYAYSDLLWACQGGGGGQYAIITEFTVKVYKQTGITYAVSYKWPFSQSLSVKAMAWYQDTVPTLPEAFSGDFQIHGDNGGEISIGGVYLGTEAAATAMFTKAGLFTALGKPSNGGYQSNLNSTLGYSYAPAPIAFKSHSTMQLKKFPQAALVAIAQALANGQKVLPKSSDIQFEIQWHCFGGKVASIKPTATAYPYRNALFNAKQRAAWLNPSHAAPCLKWLATLQAATQVGQGASATGYFDYIDSALANKSSSYYFGSNVQRLQSIKQKYDPSNKLQFPYSISG